MSDDKKHMAALWEHLTTNYQLYLEASVAWQSAIREATAGAGDRVALLRFGLRRGDKLAAFALAESLTTEEKKELLPEWMLYATSGHSDLERARAIVKLLPQDWLAENIEGAVEPLLQEGDADDYWGTLDLYADLNFTDHFARLARRAAESPDSSIREDGEEAVKEIGRDWSA